MESDYKNIIAIISAARIITSLLLLLLLVITPKFPGLVMA
jgi:hypothetical protein